MKLLYCHNCHDIQALTQAVRVCHCGKSGGHYTSDITAVYWGPSQLLGISNNSFLRALSADFPENGMGKEFTAFIIPSNAQSIKRIHRATCNT